MEKQLYPKPLKGILADTERWSICDQIEMPFPLSNECLAYNELPETFEYDTILDVCDWYGVAANQFTKWILESQLITQSGTRFKRLYQDFGT